MSHIMAHGNFGTLVQWWAKTRVPMYVGCQWTVMQLSAVVGRGISGEALTAGASKFVVI